MLAIPSPDLVLNLFASAGQVLGLLTVAVGGAAAAARRKTRGTAPAPGSRRLTWAWGGLCLLTGVAFLLYHLGVQDADNRRLRTNLFRSSVEAGQKVGDTSLKTLSFSDQLEHPAAWSTEQLAAALAGGQPLNLIDVREPEEVERGRIASSWHIRYPDLQHGREGLVVPGARSVLVCYSGNRSSELVEQFRAEGIECYFVAGGYEKWLAEGRPLELGELGSRTELRELPPFPNGDVLLDTPEVETLVQERGAIFVDVRYPEEFAADHLPGAINVPLRKLLSAEVDAAIAALPRQPVVVPCYDKRSSFYALILGLRIHRAGGEFAGRYTVPHEYFVPGRSRGHVAAWEEARAGLTPIGMVERVLATGLAALQSLTGSLALAILLLVVLLRGGFAPLSWKVDADQWVRRMLRPQESALRARHADDPVRAQRAIAELHRRHRLTPGRNLAVSMAQLLLFLVFFGVVQDAALAAGGGDTGGGALLWLPGLDVPDPQLVLPILVGVLMAAILLVGPWSRIRAVTAVAGGALLVALTLGLPAGANLYLVLSLAWIAVQAVLVRRAVTGGRRVRRAGAVVALRDADQVPAAGNKAARLGRMMRAGLPVPDGFVIPAGDGPATLSTSVRRAARRAVRRLRAERVAVRSSGCNEDGDQKSYAGVFDSVLDVDPHELDTAIDSVLASMHSDRARAYGEEDERGGVVVQSMVPATWAGVLFTRHPAAAGSMLVELVEGLGDRLVGGEVTPRTIEFTRTGGDRLSGDEPPLDLAPLLELGRRAESLFGTPQDIEWAFAGGHFFLLQARDITVGAGAGDSPTAVRERERARLLDAVRGAAPDEVVYVQNELSELLPRPTPFSLSFMSSLWAPGGTVDLACRSLGVPFAVAEDAPDHVVGAFGALFVNRREEKARLQRELGILGSFRLARSAGAIEREHRESFAPALERRMRVLDAVDPGAMDLGALFELWRDVHREFTTSTYVEAERINIVADYFVKSASRLLQRRGLEPARVLADLPETVVHRAFELLRTDAADDREHEEFLQLFGHRAPHDFEFAEPRYAEDPAGLAELAQRMSRHRDAVAAPAAPTAHARLGRLLELRVARARSFQVLKEDAKHLAMRELAILRRLTLAIGDRLGLGQRVLSLTPGEVDELATSGVDAEVLATIEAREFAAEAFEEIDLPVSITVEDLETLRLDGGAVIPRVEQPGTIRGQRVAGGRDVIGRVRVLRDAAGIAAFQPGEILIARYTDPTWSPVFPLAAGLVTEVGGWLSHAAIQAREYGLAAIVAAPGAMRAFETGDVVRLGVDGTVERIGAAVAASLEAEVAEGRILEFDRRRDTAETARGERRSAGM